MHRRTTRAGRPVLVFAIYKRAHRFGSGADDVFYADAFMKQLGQRAVKLHLDGFSIRLFATEPVTVWVLRCSIH